jgi:hypothetical protein
MFGVRAVVLASMAWSFGVIVLVFEFGLIAPPVPVQSPTNQDPLSLAIAVLKGADTFKSSAVGIAGRTPNEVLAWRVIFNSPNHDEVFQDILATGSVAAQLYALTGLWFGDATQFMAGKHIVSSRSGVVRTMRGCIVGTEKLGDVLSEIQHGSWSREFLGAGRLVGVR